MSTPTDLIEDVIGLAGRELVVLRPRDTDALLDEHAFARARRLHRLLGRPVAERDPAGPDAGRPRAARRPGPRARLRPGPAQPRRRAGGRARPGDRLGAGGDRRRAAQRGAQRAGGRGRRGRLAEPRRAARARAVRPRDRGRRRLRGAQPGAAVGLAAGARCRDLAGRSGASTRRRAGRRARAGGLGRLHPGARRPARGSPSTPSDLDECTSRSTGFWAQCAGKRDRCKRHALARNRSTPPRAARRASRSPTSTSAAAATARSSSRGRSSTSPPRTST